MRTEDGEGTTLLGTGSGVLPLLGFIHLIKAMVFPVVMYGCERWTVKKAERQRIDAFAQPYISRTGTQVPWKVQRLGAED